MATLAHITLSEFELLVQQAKLPSETRLTVMFEDERAVIEVMKRKKALDAMGKLRGSGNGKLVNVLLQGGSGTQGWVQGFRGHLT